MKNRPTTGEDRTCIMTITLGTECTLFVVTLFGRDRQNARTKITRRKRNAINTYLK